MFWLCNLNTSMIFFRGLSAIPKYESFISFTDTNTLYKTISSSLNAIEAKNPYLIFDIELLKKKLQKFVSTEIQRFNHGIKVLECEKVFKFIHSI